MSRLDRCRYVHGSMLAVLLAAAGGCATTQVQLFTQGMSKAEVVRVQGELEKNGYRTHLNALDVPAAITTPTLIYSPMNRHPRRVEKLRDILAASGYPVDLVPVSRGNHFYTTDNVGIYLEPPPPGQARRIRVVGVEFGGQCPSLDATLVLSADHTYRLVLVRWDDAAGREDDTASSGTWQRSGGTVTLHTGSGTVAFRLSRVDRHTRYGELRGVVLDNVGHSQALAGCSFAYKELDPNK